MKNSPILGFLGGFIVILVIVIFSLGYQLNKAHEASLRERVLRIKTEENASKLEKKVHALGEKIKSLESELEENKKLLISKEQLIKELKLELEKLNRLKEKLEENLKEELMKESNL